MTQNLIHVWNLGRIRYLPALRIQETIAKGLKANPDAQNVILMLEHEPVYTTGIRTQGYTKDEERRLQQLGADFVRTNRGGLITFHGPGQLVVYPILNLRHFLPQAQSRKALLGVKWYIDRMEQVIIDLCSSLNLNASRSPHTGVWIGDNKVCAMGVRNSGFITMHGLALNCNVDLTWFDHIVPCGIEDKGVTSLSRELNRDVSAEEVSEELKKKFGQTFACQISDSRPEIAKELEIEAAQ